MSYTRDRKEFRDRLHAEGVADDVDISNLLRLARVYHKYAEDYCNRPLTAEDEKRAEDAQAGIRAICAKHKIKVKFSGDPRGFTTKLFLPSGAYNSWGGASEGYGVPTPSDFEE